MNNLLSKKLKGVIERKVFIKNSQEQIGFHEDPDAWIFDFRRVLMRGEVADTVSEIFYETHKNTYPFQLGALEVAGIPLVTSLMNKFYHKDHTDINAFFIRKSRKKTALMRMVEGEIEHGKNIILVDDVLNTGSSFWRQIEVLNALGYKVEKVWSIIQYRDLDYYQRFHDLGIKIESLYTLNDFTKSLGGSVQNLLMKNPPPLAMPFELEWIFKSKNPSYGHVVSKSQPTMDEQNIYFGSDNRTFWAINQKDGSISWKYTVGPHIKRKSIFSNPVIYKDMVIFGSYDGNVYALNRHTGEKKWISFEADWVGSSPALAEDINIVFIGLEFGLIKKRGGIIALNGDTGKTIWFDTHPAYTHSSPCYIPKHTEVVIGSNDGVVRMYDARTGAKKWEFTTFGGARYDTNKDAGFGEGDIKEGFAYSEKHGYIIFGSIDSFLYILERKTGHLAHHYKCLFGIYSTPYIYKDRVYFTSTDKNARCLDLRTFKVLFEKNLDETRIFSTPTVINEKLYVGTNAARLHELDPDTGERLGYFQALERITNTVIYNQATEAYYLPTYANEIIKLKRKG